MGLFSGRPRKRRKGVVGANKVACAICAIPGLSIDMVWMQIDSPGHPSVKTLVHPECKDLPHPSVDHPSWRARPERTPFQKQPPASHTSIESQTNHITVSAAVFAVTGTTSATVAQATGDPTVNLTGTGFTTDCRGRIKADSTRPENRTTTFSSSTAITFELDTLDITAGTVNVGAVRLAGGSGGLLPGYTTYDLTIT